MIYNRFFIFHFIVPCRFWIYRQLFPRVKRGKGKAMAISVDSMGAQGASGFQGTQNVPVSPAASAATEKPQVETEKQTADTVELSLASRVKSLDQQGQSAKQIADSLGIDLKTVQLYV
jgi:DNA-binding NarL/FixJ family response regulator